MATLSDTTITVCENVTFPLTFTMTGQDGNPLVLAETVTLLVKIAADMTGAVIYATLTAGAIDRANAILGAGLTADEAATYVDAAFAAEDPGPAVRTKEYGVWDATMDELTDTKTVTGGDQDAQQLTIAGDYERLASSGAVLVWAGSTGNDATYTSVGAQYDDQTDVTTIAVGAALPSAVFDGNITLAISARIGQGSSNASRQASA